MPASIKDWEAKMRCLVVGHIVRDVIVRGPKTEIRIGGGAYYSAVTLSGFCEVEVLTSVGRDFPQDWFDELRQRGIKLHVVPSEESTSYLLHYIDASTRELRLLSVAEKIQNIPGSGYDLIVLNPVAGEIPPGTVVEALKKSPFVAADLQGFVREPEKGKVLSREVDASFLRGLKVLHADVLEIGLARGLRPEDVEVLLVSNGEKEGRAYLRGREYRFKPVKIPVEDSTGAGDVFLAAFSHFYHECPFVQALKRAAAFTALFLRHRSPDFPMEEASELAMKVEVVPTDDDTSAC